MADVDAGTVKAKVQITYDGSGIDKAKKDLESLSDIVGGPLAEGTSAANDALSDLDTQMGKSADSTDSFVSSVGSLEKPLERGTSGIASVSEALSEQQDVIADTGKAYESLQKPIESATVLMDDVPPSMASISKSAESMQKQLTTVNDSFASINDSLAQISEPNAGNWTEYPWSEANQNLQVFQAALEDPEPFKMIFDHLDQTGQTYDNFTNSIGENNADLLHEMSMDWAETSAWIDTGSDSFANMGKSAKESFGAVEASAADADKAVAEFFGKSGGGSGGGESSKGGFSFGEMASGITGALWDVASPIMAVQFIASTVADLGKGIYDAAVIAEGPAAHGIGTFTGAVDLLGQHVQDTAGVFAEGFGKGVLPTLDAINNVAAQTNDDGFWGGLGTFLGGALGTIGNIIQIGAGGLVGGIAKTLTLNPNNTFGQDWMQAGGEGLANTWAAITGQPEPFPGPAISVQQQQQQQQFIQAAAALNAQANSPQYMAAQAYLQSQGQYVQMGQMSYNDSHLSYATPYDYTPQAYQATVLSQLRSGALSLDQTGWSDIAKNKYYFDQGAGIDDNTLAQMQWNAEQNQGGGCFPSGTRVLLANGSEKSIETLRVGEQVLAHDGTQQVVTTVLALIRPPQKRVYEIAFDDGSTLTLTDSHPIMSEVGWKSISPRATKKETPDLSVTALKIRDKIVTIEGTRKLIAIRPRSIVQVYNIEVDNPHTFYAGDVLVHNKFATQLMQNFADTQIPAMDMKNTNLMQSLTSNFTGTDLSHTFTANISWATSGDLAHTFEGVASWLASGGLQHTFEGVASWLAQGGLQHTFEGIASWLAQGDLAHTFEGVASWLASGGLQHTFEGVASWLAQGGLQHTFEGVASWLASGGLQHTFEGVASWLAQGGLQHTFEGVASWIGQNLQHTFEGVASWVMNGMSQAPSGAVTGFVPGFASGVEGFRGGLAVVGEHGPELVTLPQGASVYPQPSSLSPLDMLSGNMANSNGPFVINIYFDSRKVAEQVLPHMPSLVNMYAGGY